MANQIQLELIISAQVDRVLAGMSSFERSLNQIEKAHLNAGAQADVHSQKIENLLGPVHRLAQIGNVFAIWNAAQQVFGALEGVEKFNVDIAHMTDYLQGNATAASTWMQVAELMGIDVTVIDKAFVTLSKNMNNENSPALRQMGISAEDSRGKLHSINDVLLQAVDYFHAHAGASNNANLAQELFGKSGYQLLPILEEGRSALNAITDEARKYGLVLDSEAIQRNLVFTYQLKESEMAVRGLGVSIGNAALPGLAAMASGLDNLIERNLPAFTAAIQRVVSYALGLAEGLTGMDLVVDGNAAAIGRLASTTSNLGSAAESGASGSNALADAEQRVRDQTKDATDAIDAQIKSLQAAQDARKFSDEQTKLKEKSADEQLAIVKLQQDHELALFLGNAVQARQIDEQLTTAKEQNAQTQLDITRGQQGEETKVKISALEVQKKSIQDASTAQIQEMQRAARGGSAAFNAMGAGISPMLSQAGKDAGDQFKFAMDSAAEATGKSMGGKLLDALFGPETSTVVTKGKGGQVESIITGRSGQADWLQLGKMIGEAVGVGVGIGFGEELSKIPVLGGLGTVINQVAAGLSASFNSKNPDNVMKGIFAEGGLVPGAAGEAVPIVAHARELILNPAQQQAVAERIAGVPFSASVPDFVRMLDAPALALPSLPALAASATSSTSVPSALIMPDPLPPSVVLATGERTGAVAARPVDINQPPVVIPVEPRRVSNAEAIISQIVGVPSEPQKLAPATTTAVGVPTAAPSLPSVPSVTVASAPSLPQLPSLSVGALSSPVAQSLRGSVRNSESVTSSSSTSTTIERSSAMNSFYEMTSRLTERLTAAQALPQRAGQEIDPADMKALVGLMSEVLSVLHAINSDTPRGGLAASWRNGQ